MELLTQQYVDTLEALIISHNDSDHDSNVSAILNQYRKGVKRIFFLQDRTGTNKMPKTFGILRCGADGDFPDPERLETAGGKPQQLFSHSGVVLSALYPDMMQNCEAQAVGRPNLTSAILRLSCDGRRVIFSGDATIEAWDWLARRFPEAKPLACDVMTVPHHGGAISDSDATEAASQRRLYAELIRPEYGIVSVGTVNHYDHPSTTTMKALRDAGVTVLCTQMTPRCANDLEVIRSLRGSLSIPSRSTEKASFTAGAHKSKHVACFGSISVEISRNDVRISHLTRHQQNMQAFTSLDGFIPLCRPAR
jgi:beta-lactamase superfamily II metal-dependent hydrolase